MIICTLPLWSRSVYSMFFFNSSVVTIKEMSFQGSSDTREKNPFPLIPCHANSGDTKFCLLSGISTGQVLGQQWGSFSLNRKFLPKWALARSQWRPSSSPWLPCAPSETWLHSCRHYQPLPGTIILSKKISTKFFAFYVPTSDQRFTESGFLTNLWTIHELRTRCHVIPTN